MNLTECVIFCIYIYTHYICSCICSILAFVLLLLLALHFAKSKRHKFGTLAYSARETLNVEASGFLFIFGLSEVGKRGSQIGNCDFVR